MLVPEVEAEAYLPAHPRHPMQGSAVCTGTILKWFMYF